MRRLIFAMALLFVAMGCKNSNVDDVVEPMLRVDIESIEIDYQKQSVEIAFDKIELMDNKEDGMLVGDVRFILYKGDHYHLTVRTDGGDNIYVDTHDVWDDRDIVGVKIQPDDMRIKRV